MECDICGRAPGSNLPFHCPTCARTRIYPLRIEHASTLLDKERLGRHVEAVIEGSQNATLETVSVDGLMIDTRDGAKRAEVDRLKSQTDEAQDRMSMINEQMARLKQEMEETKRLIADRKAVVAQRKSDAGSATFNLDSRSETQLESVRKGMKRTEVKSHNVHTAIVNDRIGLCREAAWLAGLKRRKRKTSQGFVKEEYSISGTQIWDLRNLNAPSHAQLTTSLTNIANLLVRVAKYLGLRLPAEIVLPHVDFPQPVIFSPSSSYTERGVPFPGAASQSSSQNLADSKPADNRPLPRPRSLFVRKKLPRLAKEDPAVYVNFVEGASYLAWNVAWLCRVQGMGNFSSWEDVCDMGRNLYYLLAADPTAQAMEREVSGRSSNRTSSPLKNPILKPPSAFGQFSQATSISFLGTAEYRDFMLGWKLQNPTKVIDEVKAHLQAEMQGAEWEVLDGKEWDDGDGEEAVLVGTNRGDPTKAADDDGRSVISATTAAGLEERDRPGTPGTKGINGWTKLKSRSNSDRKE